MTLEPPLPRHNPNLLGQAAAEADLLRAWRSGRLPHGWLLTGRFGLGKATLAFRFARFLLAGGGDAMALPADHPVVRLVAAGAHPDLVVVEPKNPKTAGRRLRVEIGVDAIRTAIERLHQTAVGAWRVLIVDQAHLLNANAANALLKTLEEPRPGVVVILTADATHRFPATIASRVAKLRLANVPTTTIAAWLHDVHGVDAQAARIAADLAQGSPGLACWLLTMAAADHYGAILGALRSSPPDEGHILHVADALAAVLDAGDTMLAVDLIARLVRRAVGRRFGERLAPLHGDETAVLDALGARLDRLWQVWDNLARLDDEAERLSLDRRLLLVDIAADLLGAEQRATA